jgi:hypothetical protein
MDQINQELSDFNQYDINYINQLTDIYNLSSDDDIQKIEDQMDLQYKNISLKPEDIIDLKLIELSKLRNYYNEAPSNDLSKFYAYDFQGNKITFESKVSGPNYDDITYETIDYDAEDKSDTTCDCEVKNEVPVQIDSKRNIYTGFITKNDKKIEVTIEWIDPKYSDILDELSIWNDLKEKGIDIPYVWTDYSFWGRSVLIKQKLYALDITDSETDNIYKLGIQILKILQKLNPFGILNNLSPENIGKDPDGNYWILDYSKIAELPLYYGFRRIYWNNLWSSQVAEQDQTTTIWNDLMELAYLLNYLYMKSSFGTQIPELKTFSREIDKVRNPKIYKFANLIKSHCPSCISKIKDKIYDDLIKILKE